MIVSANQALFLLAAMSLCGVSGVTTSFHSQQMTFSVTVFFLSVRILFFAPHFLTIVVDVNVSQGCISCNCVFGKRGFDPCNEPFLQ